MADVLSRFNFDDLVKRYEAGESIKKLADSLGISREPLRKALVKAGVNVRGRSDAEKMKWSQIKADAGGVTRQIEAAWKARRGGVDTDATKKARAATRYAKRLHISPRETMLAAEMSARGLCFEQQFPVECYNIDIAMTADLIAVELESFGPRPRLPGKYAKRLKYLLNRGWFVLIVVGHCHRKPDYRRIADDIISITQAVRGNEAMRGHYAMIRSDGKGNAGSHSELDGIPRVLDFEPSAKCA